MLHVFLKKIRKSLALTFINQGRCDLALFGVVGHNALRLNLRAAACEKTKSQEVMLNRRNTTFKIKRRTDF